MKTLIALSFGVAALALCPAQPGFAQSSYPAKPIQVIVPFPAGGPTDLIARRVAEKLQQSLEKAVIVENRPGGGTLIGAESVMRAEPDGYTVLCATVSTYAVAPWLYKKRNYNPKAALAPVVLAAETPNVLVANPKLEATSVADLIAYAKKNPGKVSFGSVGAGTTPHLMGEMLKRVAGIDAQHVPYKGSALALNDLVAGHVAFMFDQMGSVSQLVRAGQLKALGVAGPKRYPVMPELPTMSEVGYPVLARTAWTAFAVPAGTPAPVIGILNREINKALQDPDVKNRLEQTGTFTIGGSPEHFRDVWNDDETFWREAVVQSGVELE